MHFEALKTCLAALVGRALAGNGGPTPDELRILAEFYDKPPLMTQDMITWRISRELRPFWKKWLSFGG